MENADVPSPVGTSVADVTCCDSCVSEAFSCDCPDSGSDAAVFVGDRRRLLYRIGIILRRDGAFRTAGKCQ